MHAQSAVRLAAALLLAAALSGVWACSNSFLRNLTEAGTETVLDDPLPTPTHGAKK